VGSTLEIIQPTSLLAATPAVAYRGQVGTMYRYEMPTATPTPRLIPTPTIIEGSEADTPAPVWPFIVGGVCAIVIGCVLAVVDRTLRATGAPEEPML